ncbi:MAG: nucleotidyltransferase family protein [Pseudonocardiaceae bacterium]
MPYSAQQLCQRRVCRGEWTITHDRGGCGDAVGQADCAAFLVVVAGTESSREGYCRLDIARDGHQSTFSVVPQEISMTSARRDRPPSLSELRSHRDAILAIARRHGVLSIRVFGSVARGDAGSGSDVDLLVELEPGRSLFDLGGLLMDLRDFLEGPVDVVTPAALRERVRARVVHEAVPL